MTKEQETLYNANVEIAEWLSADMACAEASVELLFKEAKESLRKAVIRYNAKKHGEFEPYIILVIRRDLNTYINSSGNRLFNVKRREEDLENSYFEDGEDFLEAELEDMHREWGWDDPEEFEEF